MDQIDREKVTASLEEFERKRKNIPKLEKYRDRNKEAQQGFMAVLQKNALLKMSSGDVEEIFRLLKRTHIDGIQNGFQEKIRHKDIISVRSDFIDLLYGEMPFNTRYTRFRERYKGFGVSNITCMLSLVFPDEHITVDRYSVTGLAKLNPVDMQPVHDIKELLNEKDGGVYSHYVGLCKEIRCKMWDLPSLSGADLTTVHEFFYYLSTKTDAG